MAVYSVIIELMEYLADIFNFLCGKITVNPEKERKRITWTVAVLAAMESLAKKIRPDIVRVELDFLQKRWQYICLFILLVAVIPPFMAVLDKKKAGESVKKGYARGNFCCNIAGAACAVALLFIAHYVIEDFRFLEDFHIDSIFKIMLPICLWVALSYQSIEQQSARLDHDASLKWRNQRCNMLHLFNVYFWVFFSTVLIIAYTIYCYIHNVQLTMNLWYLVFLSIVLVFFYVCANNDQGHIKLVFVVDVPVILICSIYWMSWFQFSDGMRLAQFMFILVHSLLYIRIIYREAGIMAACEPGEKKDPEYKVYFKSVGMRSFRLKVIQYKVKSWFHIITFFLILVAYGIFWVLPNIMTTERIEFAVAKACIDKICTDTDRDVETVIDEMKSCTWYDDERQDMDRTQFLIFVYDELGQEMKDKDIIRDTDKAVSYENLIEWSVKMP